MFLLPFRQRLLFPVVVAIAAALAAVLALQSDIRPASALTNCTVSDSALALDAEEAKFLTLINNYRAQNGRSALKASTNLNRASAWMANDLGTKRYFSHTDSLGRSPSTRAQNCDYPGGAGENIAAGTVRDTAQEAFDAWKASSGHNANMLNSSYKTIGIGRQYVSGSPYGWYWVTNFGLVDDGTSGGGTTTPAPTVAKAAVTSPTPGATLSGASATFAWNAGSSALEYRLDVGTTAGGTNLYSASRGLNRSASVGSLPTNGSTVYVRLWTRFSSGWQYNDYTYRAATTTTTAPVTTKATMISPANGSTFSSTRVGFSWTAGTGAREYRLDIGTSTGGKNLLSYSAGTGRAVTISGFPRDGRMIYVRLWTRFDSGWQYNDYAYRAPR